MVSLHSFGAGGLQVISAQYWVDHTGVAVATTGSNRAVGILTGYEFGPSTMLFCPVTSYGSLCYSSSRLVT